MRSSYFLEYILQFCNRTNLPKVNRKEVSGFSTPLPPLGLQEQFADFVKKINKSKVAVQKALDEAQLLFDSLMQEYFG
jgi:type I restriction enzyme S subunit